MRALTCRPSLRARLSLAAVMLMLLAVLAAGIGAWGLQRSQSHADEAMAAQRRIEAYDALSGRLNEWILGWLAPTGGIGGALAPVPDNRPVLAALERIETALERDVEAAPSQAQADERARQGLGVARLHSMFNQLDRALRQNPPDSPAGQAALAFHGAQFPTSIGAQIEAEIQRRDAALVRMEALRRPLLIAAASIALAAPVVLIMLYLALLRPLFRRLAQAAALAPAMATGRLPAGAGGHDELGLTFARLRQMAARVERLRASLETTVAARTAELRAANQRLELVDRTRRRFFADVSHELRTPLTVIMGEAELGADHPDAAIRASLHTIGARAQRLFRRIEDLLRIARSESGRLELHSGPVDLGECVRSALSDLGPVLKRAGVTTDLRLQDLRVRGDGDWLRQVFAGLFDNAAKYAGSGAVVSVTARADGGRAVIGISDTGPGLPPGADQDLFQRFSRDEGPGGFGVGLALARWVVDSSGGSLERVPSDRGLALELVLPLWEDG